MNTKELFDAAVKRFPKMNVSASHTFRSTEKKEPDYYGLYVGDSFAFSGRDTPIESLIDIVSTRIPTPEDRIAKAREVAAKALAEVAALESQLTSEHP